MKGGREGEGRERERESESYTCMLYVVTNMHIMITNSHSYRVILYLVHVIQVDNDSGILVLKLGRDWPQASMLIGKQNKQYYLHIPISLTHANTHTHTVAQKISNRSTLAPPPPPTKHTHRMNAPQLMP